MKSTLTLFLAVTTITLAVVCAVQSRKSTGQQTQIAALQGEPLHYWRDKAGHEVDFVLARRGRPPLAIECKWSAADLSIENLRTFRHRYPDGENVVVAQDADRSVTRSLGGIRVTVESLRKLIQRLSAKPGR